MSTFGQLTDQVLQNLQGDSLDQNEQTFLTSPIGPTDTTIPVDEVTLLSQGLCEVGDELLWVKQINTQTNMATVSDFGRGYRSTTAQSWPAGTPITNNPRYSRSRVKQTINTAVVNVYPDLYGIKTYEFPYVGARLAYELPEGLDQIHNMTWQSIGPSKVWIPITEYYYQPDANTTAFPSGKSVTISDSIIPGRTVRVTYITAPDPMEDDSDDFTITTGLAVTAEETIVYGACYRLVGFLEPPRLQTNSVESSQRGTLVPPGSGINAGQFFFNLYQIAMQQERERLLRSNKTIMHRVRRLV